MLGFRRAHRDAHEDRFASVRLALCPSSIITTRARRTADRARSDAKRVECVRKTRGGKSGKSEGLATPRDTTRSVMTIKNL